MNIVIINDDIEERDFLTHAFRHVGLQVFSYRDHSVLISHAIDKQFELILLGTDLLEKGEKIVTELRTVSRVPIIIVADLFTEAQHCHMLDNGVDMLFQRPYSLRLLIRYSKLVLRRASGIPPSLLEPVGTKSLKLDPSNRSVSVYGGPLKRLTQLEFRLLYVLIINRDQVVSTDELIERVWGYTGDGNRDLVRGLVRRLRKKIEPEGRPHFIQNLPGVGYRFIAGD